MPETARRVLCIDDDNDTCELLNIILQNDGFEAVVCKSAKEGIETAKQGNFSAIVLDYRMADLNGVQVCREIRKFDSATPIVFFSAVAFPDDKKAAIEAGAQAYLVKPTDLYKIVPTIKELIATVNQFPQRISEPEFQS
jgi:DNA-binding response OmpR family regulator